MTTLGRGWSSVAATGGAVAFAAFATGVSWDALADRRGFDLVLRGIALAGIVAGAVLLRRGGVGLGALLLAAATSFFIRDLRASHTPVVFVFGFWFAYLWTGISAHLLLSWPSGRLDRPARTIGTETGGSRQPVGGVAARLARCR